MNAIQALSQLSYTPTYLYPLCRKGFGILKPDFIRFFVGLLTGYCALPAELYPYVNIEEKVMKKAAKINFAAFWWT